MLPYPFAGPFDYLVPAGLEVRPGDIVMVPLNRREEAGIVWDHPANENPIAANRLKSVIAVVDTPPMRADLRRLIDWMAAYTLSPPGEVMRMALRVLRPDIRPVLGWMRAPAPSATGTPAPTGARLTGARQRVLERLAAAEPRTMAELSRQAQTGAPVIRGMRDAGLLVAVSIPTPDPFVFPNPDHIGPVLSPDQAHVAAALREAVAMRKFSVTLLDGVTGSGKTEVYLEAIAEALRQGRQALILLPEIALSAQFLSRFERRFGTAPAV